MHALALSRCSYICVHHDQNLSSNGICMLHLHLLGVGAPLERRCTATQRATSQRNLRISRASYRTQPRSPIRRIRLAFQSDIDTAVCLKLGGSRGSTDCKLIYYPLAPTWSPQGGRTRFCALATTFPGCCTVADTHSACTVTASTCSGDTAAAGLHSHLDSHLQRYRDQLAQSGRFPRHDSKILIHLNS